MRAAISKRSAKLWGMALAALALGTGLLPASDQDTKAELAARLEQDVRHLAITIGPRYYERPEALAETIEWIDGRLKALNYKPTRQAFQVGEMNFTNVEIVLPGAGESGETIVVGAHYDTCGDTPGADDNGSAVATLLELARRFQGKRFDRELRLVFFANEEPPFFGGEDMGSRHHARMCKDKGMKISGMLALETMGYYSDKEGSQRYPEAVAGLFPTTGNFIAFVSDLSSRPLLEKSRALFAKTVDFPSVGSALPANVTGVDWSDHASYWEEGYPALMVTDTALFRNPHYHAKTDEPKTLSYDRLARVTLGLEGVIAGLLKE